MPAVGDAEVMSMTVKKTIAVVILAFFLSNSRAASQSISFTSSGQNTKLSFLHTVVGDLDGNGWLEPLGAFNDGAGHLLPFSNGSMGLECPAGVSNSPDCFFYQSQANEPFFVRPNDTRLADFDGDGCPD